MRRLLLRTRAADAVVALLLFAGVFALLVLWHGSRLVLQTNDEGVILDASQRMLAGQRLYLDFFGYMSPGSYWLQELVFRLLGTTLLAGRLPVLFDTALQCALVFWLAAELLSRRAALTCAALFLSTQIWDVGMVTAQHRCDSATLALAALCCAWRARGGSGWWLFVSGSLAAAAALCTPSVALAGAGILVWTMYDPAVRRSALAWVAGAFTVVLAAAAALWQQGVLRACLDQMIWVQQHYSAVNATFYGAVNGGYRVLLGQAWGADLLVRCFVVFWVALPAILPIIGIAAGLTWMMRAQHAPERHSIMTLLTVGAAALVASAFPRLDAPHLDWIIAVPFVLAFTTVASLRNGHLQGMILSVFCFSSLLFLPRWINGFAEQELETPVGEVRIAAEDGREVTALLKNVRRGDTMYVHPYMPMLYFLAQGRNPTRYSYLAPGSMSDDDAEEILTSLQQSPPQWVLYRHLNPLERPGRFPAADPASTHFTGIDNWIAQQYRATDVSIAGYQLMRKAPLEQIAQGQQAGSAAR